MDRIRATGIPVKCFVCRQNCLQQELVHLTSETKRNHSLKSVLEIILKSGIENLSEENSSLCVKCHSSIEQYDELYLKLIKIEEEIEKKFKSSQVPRHVCQICEKVFKSEAGLEAHVKQCHEGNSTPWNCHLCAKNFTRKASLEEHLDRHKLLKQRHCQICDKYFYPTAYWRHMTAKHKEGGQPGTRPSAAAESSEPGQQVYQCGFCPPSKRKSFQSAEKLKLHIRNVHTKVANSQLCVKCGQTFSNYHAMYQHQRRFHPSIEPEEATEPIPDTSQLQSYICAFPSCGAEFDQIQSLQKHQEENHRHERADGELDEDNIENTDVNIIYIADIEETDGDQRNLAEQNIELELVNVDKLIVPAGQTVSGEQSNLLICNYCGNSYKNEESRILHIKTVHTDQKPYKCSICDKTFSIQRYLTQHQRVHFSKDKFKCNLCDKTFSSNKVLKRHMRTHTGEKPYSCEFCEKTFAAASNLSEHRTLHTGRMPYECEICKKKFRLWTTLRKHLVKCKGEP